MYKVSVGKVDGKYVTLLEIENQTFSVGMCENKEHASFTAENLTQALNALIKQGQAQLLSECRSDKMSEQQHTQEPWEADEVVIRALDDHGTVICRKPNEAYSPFGFRKWEVNARRIVACVNACAGMSTEDLEANVQIGDVILELQAQRTQLLAELSEAADLLKECRHDTYSCYSEYKERTRGFERRDVLEEYEDRLDGIDNLVARIEELLKK